MAKKNDGVFWDIEIPICEVELSAKSKIVIKNVSLKNVDYVDIRKNYMDKEGSWKHGKGIAIPMDKADEIADIIKGAVKQGIPF